MTRLVSNSIAARLAAMFALVVLAGFTLLSVALYYAFQHELARHQREAVQDRLEGVRYLLVHDRSPQLAQFVRKDIQNIAQVNPNARFWMWSEDPAYRYGDGAERIARQFQQLSRSGQRFVQTNDAQGQLVVIMGMVVPANDVHPSLVLMAGDSRRSFARLLQNFELQLVLSTLAGAALVAVCGYWIARVGLRPLARMSADARAIGVDSRGQRLALTLLPYELLHLGHSFNAALDRLDGAYRQLETFNADVAHELRTPLTNLIGQTQVALAREREMPALREVLQSNLEELERLRAIIADMLFLARAEQGERARQRVPTSIAAEVSKTVEFFEALLDETGIRVTVHGDAVAPIETALFRRALTNLLQNAIQHSPSGAAIEVRITHDADSAAVAFNNPGESIPPERLARLFDRFYRIDAARRNSDESHGLGLAIVKAVAAMHHGTVFARTQDGIVTVGFSVALQD
ncbi:MAG: heavy metal sensor histidine kinase [Burkholderiaceae bacterium]|jgi:two-component system heavy metal sensor histidine kinase CusS|nr:heavy metal sensor histidine kinase [Burkholderiaceae bacterium]